MTSAGYAAAVLAMFFVGAAPGRAWNIPSVPLPFQHFSGLLRLPRSPTSALGRRRETGLVRVAAAAPGTYEARGMEDKNKQRKEREAAFLRWARERGISAPKLAITEFGGGYRGMVATDTIAEGEDVVSVPRAWCLSVGNRQPCPLPTDFVGPGFWNMQSLHVRLALLLLYERGRAEAEPLLSPFKVWLDLLPESHADKPVRWSKEELEELRDPLLVEEIEEQRAGIDAIHARLMESVGGQCMVPLADFRWAMDTVISRTFGGQVPKALEPGAWQTALTVVLSSLARELPPLRALGGATWKRLCDGTATSDDLLLVEPLVDMLNHRTTASSVSDYDAGQDAVRLRTARDGGWAAGEEVLICYGCKTNRNLLKFYGFVERGNPVDATVVGGGVAAARAVFDEALGGDGGGWEERERLAWQCGVLSDADRLDVSAGGPGGRGVAGMRLLLCSDAELDTLQSMLPSERTVAELSVGTEERVCLAILGALRGAAEACGGAEGEGCESGVGGAAAGTARAYREERRALLERAMERVRSRAALSRDMGAVVEAAEEGWLAEQRHAMLRDMSNLGF